MLLSSDIKVDNEIKQQKKKLSSKSKKLSSKVRIKQQKKKEKPVQGF